MVNTEVNEVIYGRGSRKTIRVRFVGPREVQEDRGVFFYRIRGKKKKGVTIEVIVRGV